MAYFWQSLRTGAWLTPDRVRGYSLLMLAISFVGMVIWVALSDHLIGLNGQPLGTDFTSFYAAGSLVLEGKAGDVYSMALHHAREQQIFGTSIPYYAWLYPPLFLLIATPLALMPYALALIVWQVSTLALYLLVIGMIVRHTNVAVRPTWVLVAAAFPAVFINLGHGQNGLLTAGLLGAALVALPKRPAIPSMLFGLLAYKPQFALVIPIALLAAGHWRATAAAGMTVVAVIAATVLVFGFDVWSAFAASTEASRKLLLEQGNIGFEKLQSAFAAVRILGGGIPLAYVVQGMLSTAVIFSVAWAWRTRIDDAQKFAILIVATLLAQAVLARAPRVGLAG